MKKTVHIHIYLTIIFAICYSPTTHAQDTVPYPYSGYYITEDTTCAMWNAILPFGVTWEPLFFSFPPSNYPYTNLAKISTTEPINDIYNTRIYGLAFTAKTVYPNDLWRFTPEITHELNFEGVVYSFIRRYSDVKLLKQVHCTIDSGQAPDKLLCDYRILGYFDRYSLPQRSFAYLPVYEFYFDEPIDVSGSIYIGMKYWSDSLMSAATFIYPNRNNGIYFGNHNVPNHHVSGDYSSYYQTCRPNHYYCRIYGDSTIVELEASGTGWYLTGEETDSYRLDSINKIHNYYGSFCFAITQPRSTNISHPEKMSNSITLMPNPATDWLTIRSDMPIEQVVVYDVMGKAVLQRSYDDKRDHRTLNVQHLNNGVYIIKVFSEGQFVTQRFIKK